MKKSAKIVVIILAIVLAIILLTPQVAHYDDGGTVEYRALLYTVYDWHVMGMEWDNQGREYEVGCTVEILGITVFDHRYPIIEKAEP